MTDSAAPRAVPGKKHKIVISCKDGAVTKGYLCTDASAELKSLDEDARFQFPEALEACVPEDGSELNVDWSHVKAVFFVSSFEGDREHRSMRFYTSGPELQTLWVEIGFRDGEIIEGCIRNSLHHLKDGGFFLHPSTPGGNNLLIYVNKEAVVSYRVLGVRSMDNL